MDFRNDPDFCCACGAILPISKDGGTVVCIVCKVQVPEMEVDEPEICYTIKFNSAKYQQPAEEEEYKSKEVEGALVDRRCKKCNNKQMSYFALQLRSADEGQTLFYTCPKCKYKEVENS